MYHRKTIYLLLRRTGENFRELNCLIPLPFALLEYFLKINVAKDDCKQSSFIVFVKILGKNVLLSLEFIFCKSRPWKTFWRNFKETKASND